jgi:hypothetical protein
MSRLARLSVTGPSDRALPRDLPIRALMVGALFSSLTVWWSLQRFQPSDLAQLLTAGRLLAQGADVYASIGPGLAIDAPFRLYYPLTAVLATLPLASLPLIVADAAFVGFGAFALAWVLMRESGGALTPRLLVFASIPYAYVVQTSQWSPLLCAAAFVPAAGGLLLCKPTLGLALFAAYPSRVAVASAAVFGLASLALMPSWPLAWLESLSASTHFNAPLFRPGGFLVLLAIPCWREAEARLLLVLACVPQTTQFYDALPLYLVVRTWTEGGALTALAFIAAVAARVGGPYPSYEAGMVACGNWMTWGLYLPCTAFVLRRAWRGVSGAPAPNPLTSGIRVGASTRGTPRPPP